MALVGPAAVAQGGLVSVLARPLRLLAALALLLVPLLAACGGDSGGEDAAAAGTETTTGSGGEAPTGAPVLEFYWGDGCPHCEHQQVFLDELAGEYPDLVIERYEVWYDTANQQRFAARAAQTGARPEGVPTTFFGDEMWVGFAPHIEAQIRAAVDAQVGDGDQTAAADAEAAVVAVPVVGEVDVSDHSLLAATLVIGFVDGVNPCSLWALTMLLAIVVHQGSRGRVAAIGITFLAITALLYGLFIAGTFTAMSFVAHLTAIQVAVAAVALVAGLVNLKDYVWFRQGFSLTIPEGQKPGLYRRMRSAATQASLPAALAATAALAVGVSLLETPCTAGLPLLWSNLLVEQGVSGATAGGLFGVYLGVFLLDELLVFGVAVAAMRISKVQERHGRALKLVGGSLMVTLAGVLLVAPETMESLGGALVVMLVAAAVAATIAGVHHLLTRGHRPPAPPRATGGRRARSRGNPGLRTT